MEKDELTPEELQAINFISEAAEKAIAGGPPGIVAHPMETETDFTFPYIFGGWQRRPTEKS